MIVVVLSLLAGLTFLGIFFFSWSDQAAKIADEYSDQATKEVDPDEIIDIGLESIIVSTPDHAVQSAIGGGQLTIGGNTINVSDKSLLACEMGLIAADGTPADLRPRNGYGGTGTLTGRAGSRHHRGERAERCGGRRPAGEAPSSGDRSGLEADLHADGSGPGPLHRPGAGGGRAS